VPKSFCKKTIENPDEYLKFLGRGDIQKSRFSLMKIKIEQTLTLKMFYNLLSTIFI